MRFFILPAILFLAACSHQGEQVSSQTNVIAMPAAYAAPAPVVRQEDCAENFNGIVDHLEGLMTKKPQAN